MPYFEQDIICPFFVKHDQKNIYCEGLTRGTYMVSNFGTQTSRTNYEINFCNRYEYMDCPYAKILDQIKYEQENKSMKMSEKIEQLTKELDALKIEKAAVERDNYALKHQVDWREKELKRKEATVNATELLTKYLVARLAGTDELRVSITDMAKLTEKYDVIMVNDSKNSEVVCNLVDKKTKEILDRNYNAYLRYIQTLAADHKDKKIYGDYLRIKEPDNSRAKAKARDEALRELKKQVETAEFPDRKKLEIEYKTFDQYDGSFICAWFAIEK